ncbi:hypothetical protein ACMBCN_03450 [Candidatus Liberibacter asiaticus]|nr:hypothetical protein [Candidatus Liberibacter asiaticus]
MAAAAGGFWSSSSFSSKKAAVGSFSCEVSNDIRGRSYKYPPLPHEGMNHILAPSFETHSSYLGT